MTIIFPIRNYINLPFALHVEIFDSGEFHEEWAVGAIILLFKGGEKSDLDNYRGITFLVFLANCFLGSFSIDLLKYWMVSNF